jgi:hypothetical protein
VRRRRLLVPLLLALSGFGWAAAHAIAHRVINPEEIVQGTPGMHGYLSYLPVSLALCLALALPLAAGVICGLRWRAASLRSLWLFAVVPVLGYMGHALLEPLIAGSATLSGTSATAVHLTPVALVGLLVQIPFALVAVALGRHILTLAESLARWLVGPRVAVGGRTAERHRLVGTERTPVFRLDRAHGQRAPPVLHLA